MCILVFVQILTHAVCVCVINRIKMQIKGEGGKSPGQRDVLTYLQLPTASLLQSLFKIVTLSQRKHDSARDKTNIE